MIKSIPIELARQTLVSGSTLTYRLSVVSPFSGMMAKRETKECCVAVALTAITGSTPTIAFDVYETVDGHDFHVGTTGAMSSSDDRVIDSKGGVISCGQSFSAGTPTATLRLLGKGTDMYVIASTTGTIATATYVINAILYM